MVISSAVHGAKRTYQGLPTYTAILDRMWIEAKTERTDRVEWERSFEAACEWLNWQDVEDRRAKLLASVDAHLSRELQAWARSQVYQRRAAVLTCAGMRFQGTKPAALGSTLR